MLYVCVKFKNAIKMTKFEKRQKMWEYCINNLPFSDDDFNTRRRNKYDFMNKDRNPNKQVHDVMTFGAALHYYIDLATLYNKGSKWVYDQMVYFYDNVINEDIYKNE